MGGKWVHRLSMVDEKSRTALCAECGPVAIKSKGAVQWQCANKRRAERKVHRRKQKQDSQGILQLYKLIIGCQDCGYGEHAEALDFDHRPNEDKLFTISGHKHRYSWAAIIAEVEKCDVVCANCHRVRTANRRT
jgi:L-lysine 2,3-aminomutase